MCLPAKENTRSIAGLLLDPDGPRQLTWPALRRVRHNWESGAPPTEGPTPWQKTRTTREGEPRPSRWPTRRASTVVVYPCAKFCIPSLARRLRRNWPVRRLGKLYGVQGRVPANYCPTSVPFGTWVGGEHGRQSDMHAPHKGHPLEKTLARSSKQGLINEYTENVSTWRQAAVARSASRSGQVPAV